MISERIKGWLSTSSKMVAASARLAKKQAELATLNNVTLPRLYHAIGKRIIGSKSLPTDLTPHREKIRELEAAIAAKPEEPKPEPASGFAAKAKQLAQQAASKTAKATADATAVIRIQAAYVSLGKEVVEKYAAAIPDDLAAKLTDVTTQQQNLESVIAALTTPRFGQLFTQRRVFLATLGCVGVLGGVLLVRGSGERPERTVSGFAGATKPDALKNPRPSEGSVSKEEIDRQAEKRRVERADARRAYTPAPVRSSRDKVSTQDFYELPRQAKMSQVIAAVGEPSRKEMPTGREELIEWYYFGVPARYGTDLIILYFDKFTERLSFIRDGNGVQSRK